MVFSGPGAKSGPMSGPMSGLGLGLGMALALVATLGACGSDPPRAEPRKAESRTVGVPAAAPAFAPAIRTLSLPVKSPSPEAAALAAPLPVAAPFARPAPPASYPPQDECATLPGFAAFRDSLFAAVRKRDAAALTALADPAVNLDFGGGSGVEEWRKRLEATPALWGELAALEGLGCAADGGIVTLPWIFSRVPDSVDVYSAMLVTGQGVPLLAQPAADATPLARLDWVLLEAVGSPEPAAYREIASGPKTDRVRGFVETARLRGVLDYRLIADRQNGEWNITAFVAGD